MDALDRVLQDFIVESQENLARLDHEFVALEQEPDNEDLLADIFRTIHTIKGSAGFLNLVTLEQVSHYAEDILSKLREGLLSLDSDLITVLLNTVDCIKAILLTLEKTGTEGEHDTYRVLQALKGVADKSAQPPQAQRQHEAVSPVIEETDDDQKVKKPTTTMADLAEHSGSFLEESRIHVDVELLDQLMNLTGELVLTRNQVVQLSTKIEEKQLRDIAQHMNVIVSELQETVMKTRMQQIKKVFGIFPRLIRDFSKMYGKNVRLVMEGQTTELDKTLIEGIKAPLIHLVRNAIDHGIESPGVREKFGKPLTAKIVLNAYHQGGLVNIEVSDDGAGIDVDRIKAKAIQQELISPQQAEEMGERNLLSFIFRQGFSTAEKITKISGRGVGMDIVRRNLDRIGGTIDVHTERYKGTTMKIRVPITLAIIPVLIVVAGDQRFAIPQVNLEELLMLKPGDDGSTTIETIYGAEVYRLRGELLPLIRLQEVLELAPPKKQVPSDGELNIVVLSSGDMQFGLVVDKVEDTQEIVVKPVSSHIKQLSYYDGVTIMGDGGVALILNTGGLFNAAQISPEDIKKSEHVVAADGQAAIEPDQEEEHTQTIVLFRVGAKEYYGVPLAFVVRLEEFSADQIEYSGGREVMQYRNEILPLIRLEHYVDIPLTPPERKTLSLIVFSVEKQIGLVVSEIINTVEISTKIDTDTFQQQGILGSTIVDGHAVLILDIHGLIEMAYPNWHRKFFVSNLSEEDRQNIHVLLVEDSMFFQNIEKSYLEAAGYMVTTANDGNDAWEKLQTHLVDVIVTDLAMPHCNGFELTKRVKASESFHHLPVMAVTSLSGDEDRKQGQEAGIDEYQVKLDRDEVLRSLERLVLRNRERTDEA